jgi:ABC-type thiamin/hydroxymethylpyrimidine transport system permease subunit
MSEQQSFYPTWLSAVWVASVVAFGIGLALSAYLVRKRPARILASVLASALLYLLVAAAQVAILVPDLVQGVNSASVVILLAFTYYLNGWIAALIALLVVVGIIRLEGSVALTGGRAGVDQVRLAAQAQQGH